MKSITTNWDLTLLYKSLKDPQIEKDVAAIEKACAVFHATWKNKQDYVKNTKILLQALGQYQQLMHVIGDAKPVSYVMLARDIDSTNPAYAGKISQLQERITLATNTILFFEITLGSIEKSLREKILSNTVFAGFHYFLIKIWDAAEHRLTDGEEQIMALKSEPAHQLWVAANEKLVSEQVILWKKKLIPIHQAVGMVSSLSTKDRERLHRLITKKLESISFLATAELNAVCIDKKISDQLRKFKHPYSATIMDYENDESVIMGMIALIDEHQKYTHQFFALKAQVLGMTQLRYCDMAVTVSGKKRKISFAEGSAIVLRALTKVHPKYGEIFESYLQKGQIDVMSRIGKRGGGYCWGGYNRPTYILLNWTDDFHSVMTLAHEMGHAIHRELSKKQNVLYEAHPISTAECASTLFENFVFEEMIKDWSAHEQLLARMNRVQDALATVFRQAAYFKFEMGMHDHIRTKGQISQQELAGLMQKSLQDHAGKSVVITPEDGYLFVRYNHARYFFYVYSYAYGKLISNVLFEQYKKDPAFIESINQFLSAGGSQSPEAIFKSIGVDTSQASFWKIGLDAIGDEIAQLKRNFKKMNGKIGHK